MTRQPPPPATPAPPGPEALARLRAENEALTAQITNQALREAAGGEQGGPGGRGGVSVIKDASGKVVVTTADGRTVTYDPAVGFDQEAVQRLVQTALEPPRIPRDPNRERGPDPVRIVAIVFGFVFLMTLVLSLTRVLGRRVAAGAASPGVAPEVAARLARIEQAVEAVAIEVERISESERYSARLLTERLPERLPERAAPGQQAVAPPTLDVAR
jgi:hypothetical protein